MADTEECTGAVRFRIVVPTYRRAAMLAGFLDCLGPQLLVAPDFRLTIVNDGSDNAAYRGVLAPWADCVDYVVLPENRKRVGARLAGLARASEEYVVFTDDDCRPGPLWLDWIRATVAARPHADIVAGMTTLMAPRKGWLDRFWHDQANATPRSFTVDGALITAVTSNAVFRRSLIDGIAPPAPDTHHFPDDHFITQHALENGASYLVVETPMVGHLARPGLWAFLRMQWGYGIGAAEYAVSYRSARMVRLFGAPFGQALRHGWAGEGQVPRSRLVGACARGAFALGWWWGVRRYARRAGLTVAEMHAWTTPFAEMVETVPQSSSASAAPATSPSGSGG